MKHRTTIALAGAAGLLIALAAPMAASAHVTIDPNSAEAGSYSLVHVKVPNESATAGTSKVEVKLPTDTPFSSVSYVPVPGWTVDVVKSTLPEPVTVGDNEITEAVTSVVWTAEAGSEITAGQLQLFTLSLGPVPDTGSLTLPAVQTYTDGDVVEWTETTADAEHPAPVLYINDAPAADHHAGAATDDAKDADADADADEDADTAVSASDSTGAASASPDDVLARVLAIGGLVVGAVGIVVAVTVRRSTTQD